MKSSDISRRRFGAVAGSGLASLAFSNACDATMEWTAGSDGRLTARPRTVSSPAAGGERPLGLDARRDAVLFVPSKASDNPMALLLLLHGAGGTGGRVLNRVRDAAEAAGIVVLAPDSRNDTWDAIRAGFGPDVAFIDRALARVFETVPVDRARVAIGGFSDGASYALSLGLINGDLFQHVVAFSPGFLVSGARVGQPRIFISHGTADQILPIDQTSRLIAPGLKGRGYDVTFREFDGGHDLPAAIVREGFTWLGGSPSSRR